MTQTSRELVRSCVRFEYPERLPRDVWLLPWAETHMPEAVAELQTRYPSDFTIAEGFFKPSPRVEGDPYALGSYTDEWGCTFENIHGGVIGEVKKPILADASDFNKIEPPEEMLPCVINPFRDAVNRFCAETDKFVLAGCLPRPWERYQFLRGTENALCDVLDPEGGLLKCLGKIHDFYLREIELWMTTDVDGIWFMDDWGAQQQLLIPPSIWRQIFKPLYKDYCDLAHSHDKLAFMHSDGQIADIYEDLIEDGVDAINSQLFVMDMDRLERNAKGRITFWGEMDRQHVLPAHDPEVGRRAVREVAKHLLDASGGVIAQFELGPSGNPKVAMAILDEWERVWEELKLQRAKQS